MIDICTAKYAFIYTYVDKHMHIANQGVSYVVLQISAKSEEKQLFLGDTDLQITDIVQYEDGVRRQRSVD